LRDHRIFSRRAFQASSPSATCALEASSASLRPSAKDRRAFHSCTARSRNALTGGNPGPRRWLTSHQTWEPLRDRDTPTPFGRSEQARAVAAAAPERQRAADQDAESSRRGQIESSRRSAQGRIARRTGRLALSPIALCSSVFLFHLFPFFEFPSPPRSAFDHVLRRHAGPCASAKADQSADDQRQHDQGENDGGAHETNLLPADQVARRRNALPITETDEKLIASAAISGESSSPKAGYRTPAAIGMPSAL
jgi:hypothetical protein